MQYECSGEKWILPSSWLRVWNSTDYWSSLPAVSEHKTIYTVEGQNNDIKAQDASKSNF